MTFFSIDVETDGPVPGRYSMLSIGVVAVREPLTDRFYVELRPVSEEFVPEALAVSGLDRQRLVEQGTDPATAVRQLRVFLAETSEGRPVFIGDNPAFDAAFVAYYCHVIAPDGLDRPNPFGHSARRIGDLWAGMVKDASRATEWKAFRGTAHTHNALDDALGNAEAVLELKRRGLRIGLR